MHTKQDIGKQCQTKLGFVCAEQSNLFRTEASWKKVWGDGSCGKIICSLSLFRFGLNLST